MQQSTACGVSTHGTVLDGRNGEGDKRDCQSTKKIIRRRYRPPIVTLALGPARFNEPASVHTLPCNGPITLPPAPLLSDARSLTDTRAHIPREFDTRGRRRRSLSWSYPHEEKETKRHCAYQSQEEDENQELDIDILTRFMQSFPISATYRPPVTHECSSGCRFHSFHTWHICRETGNVHQCTESTCDQIVVNVDARSCILTSTAYPLEHTAPSNYDCADMSKMNRGSVFSSGSMNTAREDRVVSRVCTYAQSSLIRINENIERLARHLEENSTGTPPPDLVNTLKKITVDMWHKLSSTKTLEGNKNKYRYRAEIHVLIIASFAVSGMSVGSISVVPCIQWVSDNWPASGVQGLQRDPRLHLAKSTQRLFTAGCKTFRAGIAELIARRVLL